MLQPRFLQNVLKEFVDVGLGIVLPIANAAGGQIIFGIQNQTWDVIGFSDDEVFQKMDAITNSMAASSFAAHYSSSWAALLAAGMIHSTTETEDEKSEDAVIRCRMCSFRRKTPKRR